ncbi:MAG TPA: hypothetical protein VH253_06685 [Phycisphaerae bacterium]|nr:hypothetical protein [Phycisphaerae bacterium]
MHRRMMVLAGVMCCAAGAVALGQEVQPGVVGQGAVTTAPAVVVERAPHFVVFDRVLVDMNAVQRIEYVPGASNRGASIVVEFRHGETQSFAVGMDANGWAAAAQKAADFANGK